MIDTHCHLDDEAYAPDLAEVVARAKAAGVQTILIPGVDVPSIEAVQQVVEKYQGYCYPAIGIHPEEIRADWEQKMEAVRIGLQQYHWIAVGEIGLDYHFDTTYKQEQKQAFDCQLSLAREHDLPVMIHSRDATEDTIKIMQSATQKGTRGVMHCFSGSYETAQIYLKMGLKLGIGGVLTFKNSKLADVLSQIPLSALVLETDGPYLAPTPHRGERNESAYLQLVVERLAAIYSCDKEQVIEQTDANARALFGL